MWYDGEEETGMLAEKGCRDRRAALAEKLAGIADWIVVTSPHHVLYFSNLWVEPNGLSHNALPVLVFNARETVLFVDNFLSRDARSAFADQVVEVPWYGNACPSRERRAAVLERAAAWLAAKKPGTVAAETSWLPAAFAAEMRARGAGITDAHRMIEDMRRVKYPDETEEIRSLVRDASLALDAVRGMIHEGMTEWSVFGLLYKEFVSRRRKLTSLIADFITDARVSGPPRDRKLEKGDLLIIDFSPYSGGYRADMAATVRVDALPTTRQTEYMEILVQAKSRAEAFLRPGVSGREIYGAMAGCFAERGVGRFFTSHAGHGLGLLHPERPYFVPDCDETLAAGDVVTLEPGLYDTRVGHMRIEDVYLITPGGPDKITVHRQGF